MDLDVGTFAVPGFAALLIQMFINIIKERFPFMPHRQYALPLMAMAAGYLVMAVSAVAEGQLFDKAGIAKLFLQGTGAGFGAIIATGSHKLADQKEQEKKIEVALKLPADSTPADVEAVILEQAK